MALVEGLTATVYKRSPINTKQARLMPNRRINPNPVKSLIVKGVNEIRFSLDCPRHRLASALYQVNQWSIKPDSCILKIL